MIQENYRTKGKAGKRYVRASVAASGDVYQWCVQNAEKPQFDVAQGICTADELPGAVKEKADAMMGHAFGYVEWPR